MAKAGSNGRGGSKVGRSTDRAPRGGSGASGKSTRSSKTASDALRDGASMRWHIPSDFAAGRDVQKAILDRIAACGFSENCTFGIKLALEEALINAIKHGNKFDPGKKVRIAATVTPKECEIVIEDEGPGFDRSCVPDPTLEENLEKCSGRGILLMEAYMTRVEWSCRGRRVRLVRANTK
ncbi:MAG: ATP-binding protein [Tepidisphaeraceae bacterium]